MDAPSNPDEHLMDPNPLLLSDDLLFHNFNTFDDLTFSCDSMSEVATWPPPLPGHEDFPQFESNMPGISFCGDALEWPHASTNGDMDGYSSMGTIRDQDGTLEISTECPSSGGYPESSNLCLSPSSFQFLMSPMPSSPEQNSAIRQRDNTENRPNRLREIRPRPPGLVSINMDKSQSSTRECKRKARAEQFPGARISILPSDKRTPEKRGKRSHTCELCGKDLPDSKELGRHYRVAHRAFAKDTKHLEIEFKCSVLGCVKKYTRKDNLKRHEDNKHPWLEG